MNGWPIRRLCWTAQPVETYSQPDRLGRLTAGFQRAISRGRDVPRVSAREERQEFDHEPAPWRHWPQARHDADIHS